MTGLDGDMTHPAQLMPDFVAPTAGFAHTVDSALLALQRLEVSDARITLRMDGPGAPYLTVTRQSPAPGVPLHSNTRIVLHIAACSIFDSLPLPMRESGGEREMGTREICRLFDSPLAKADRWFRSGSPMFAFSPQRPHACRRWLALFGVDASRWPEDLLFRLSLLMPALARLGGRQPGIQLTFALLFGIPLHSIETFVVYRTTKQISRFGDLRSRLGVDWIVGDRLQDVDGIRLRLGPTSLAKYQSFNTEQGRPLLELACDLCLSAYQDYRLSWIVEEQNQAPRLGNELRNGRVGVNFHLGRGDAA